MSYCRTKGSSLENQPRCIITLITAYLTWLIKKEARGTVSIWWTNHFLQGGKLEDSTVTCLEGRTVREKKKETEGTGREEEKLSLEAPAWGVVVFSGLLGSLPASLSPWGPLLCPAYTPLSTTGLPSPPRSAKPLSGLPGSCVEAWGVKLPTEVCVGCPGCWHRLVTRGVGRGCALHQYLLSRLGQRL